MIKTATPDTISDFFISISSVCSSAGISILAARMGTVIHPSSPRAKYSDGIGGADTRPIQIPWSTDQNILEEGQRPDGLQWEGGTFEFALKDQQGNQVALKSLTEWLHASKFVKGSQITIQPGQSISALVKFKLEDLYPIEPLRLKTGEWQLSAKWHQVGRTWHIKNCAAWNGYFHYEDFYHQQNPGLTIQVTAQDSTEPGQAKSR